MADKTEQATAWIDVETREGQPVIVLAMNLPVAHRVAGALYATAEAIREQDPVPPEELNDLALLDNLTDGIRVRFSSLIALARGFKAASADDQD